MNYRKAQSLNRHAGRVGLLLLGMIALFFAALAVKTAAATNGEPNQPCYTLTIGVNPPSGGQVKSAPTPNCQNDKYTAETEVDLTAEPASGYAFITWSGHLSGDNPTEDINMDADKSVVATFKATCYKLTLNHTGQGNDPVAQPAKSADCNDAGEYIAGQSITLTAKPADGWRVKNWSGTDNDASTLTTNTLKMPAKAHEIQAAYVEIQLYLPVVLNDWPHWHLVGADKPNNLYTFISCPTNGNKRFAGASDALYKWDDGAWSRMDGAPPNVRDFLFVSDNADDNCANLYAASFNGGVWRLEDETWNPVGSNPLPFARSLALRDNTLYVGTRDGIFSYDRKASNADWKLVLDNSNNVTRLSLAGSRLYASVFDQGVKFDDMCDDCDWMAVGDLAFGGAFDVVGASTGSPPGWVVMATAAGIYRWNGTAWLAPTAPPVPAVNVFALAMVGEQIVAGVQNGGVWVSDDHGETWNLYNQSPDHTVIDLVVVPRDGVYAVTPNDGVWLLPLP